MDRLRDFRATMEAGQRRSILDRPTSVAEYSKNLSRALLAALPVLSLIPALVFMGSGRPLLQHLIFSLHLGAVFLFTGSLMVTFLAAVAYTTLMMG